MTDSGRKDMGDSVCLHNHRTSHSILTSITELQDKVTPQGSKSTTDKLSEGVSNVGDKAQRYAIHRSHCHASAC